MIALIREAIALERDNRGDMERLTGAELAEVDKIFEPVLGSLSTPNAKLLMCGNTSQLSGFFMTVTTRTGPATRPSILTEYVPRHAPQLVHIWRPSFPPANIC